VIVAVSTRTRRLVGRLERGTDLLSQLVTVCRTHGVRAGELRAVGALEDVILGEWDQQQRVARPPRRFAAQLEIISLTATIAERDGAPALSAFASLSRGRDNGIELLGGRLLGGRVFACEFVIDAFDDLALPVTLDPATGLHLWTPTAIAPSVAAAPAAAAGAVPAVATPAAAGSAPTVAASAARAAASASAANLAVTAPPEPAATPLEIEPEVTPTHQSFELPARTSWSDVMAASERRVTHAPAGPAGPADLDDSELPQPVPGAPEVQVRPGDLIDHPKFGRVQVERVDGDNEFVSARLRNQRLIRLSLEVLTLIPAGQADGHNLFRAVAGGGR
jgi:predicted DNA-binding protein with PD1-like motif